MTNLDPIATPLTLPSGLMLPNRVAKAAMSENLANADGDPSERLVRLYAAEKTDGETALALHRIG